MRKTAYAAVALTVTALLTTGCSGPPLHGKVTRWQYTPPADQQVDVSCSIYMGSGSSSTSGSSTSNLYCMSWNTRTEPAPQDCKLTLADNAVTNLNVSEAQCKAYLGQQWPIGGSAS